VDGDGSVKICEIKTAKIIVLFSGVVTKEMIPTVIEFVVRNEDEQQV
jgi:hypothetical protein